MCAHWSSGAVSGATCGLLRTLNPPEDLRLDECPAPPSCCLPSLMYPHSWQETPPDTSIPVTIQPLASATFQDSPNQGHFLPLITRLPPPLSSARPSPGASRPGWRMLEQGCPGPRGALRSWGQVSKELLHRAPLSCLPQSLFRLLWSGLSPPTPTQFRSGSQCSRHDISPLGSPRAGCVPGFKVTSSPQAAPSVSLSFRVRVVAPPPPKTFSLNKGVGSPGAWCAAHLSAFLPFEVFPACIISFLVDHD